ncbi:MAG: hypothetical protein A2V88_13395 [Elusimicrobia bacterium RBG_16_66_12]|nr:MAG: hypothetical protein A2V88_13395 [Elusimicrobia bacterium RBG_16_66_12]
MKLKEDADPRAAAVLRRALSDVLRTPTGQEVAADFVAQNASAEVRFDKLDGTLISVNGRKVVSGIRGEARNGSVVAINRLFLDADPELASREMAGTLAHELFGHILEEQRAKNADFPLAALHRYRGDEANGRLIGWLVRTELGAPLSDGGMWGYLKDPEAFHKSLALIDPYYALTFGPDGLADPVPVLRARLEQSRRRRESMDETDIDMRKWRFVIEHFVAEHKMERRRFASVGEDSDNFLEEYSSIKREAGEVEEDIRKRIEFYGTPEGREALRKLSEASRSEHLRAFERRLERYRTRLAMETRGRKREALVPPPPDQIDFDALEKLYQDDVRDNPRHWGL